MGRLVAYLALPLIAIGMGVDWVSWKVRGRPILWLERALDAVLLPETRPEEPWPE